MTESEMRCVARRSRLPNKILLAFDAEDFKGVGEELRQRMEPGLRLCSAQWVKRMAIETGSAVVWLATMWLYAGAAVAAVFVLFGIDRIDEDARGAYSFRPLLVPGILLLWPLVLWRWWTLETEHLGWQPRYSPRRLETRLGQADRTVGTFRPQPGSLRDG